VSSLRSQAGFTLIELLVTMLITSIVFGATLSVLDVFQKDNRLDQIRAETQDSARSAMDRVARELRNVAAPSTEASGALELAETYALTFQTIDSSSTPSENNVTNSMRVHYCLADATPTNEVLYRQVKRWKTKSAPTLSTSTACPDATNGSYESTSRLVEHVVNRVGGQSRALFTYGPSTATTVAQIISVEPTLYINANPEAKPGSRSGESQLTSSISLRNQNRPPSAAFTAVQTGTSRTVQLNASESTDPDGLALTYKWWDNGTKLPTTAQQYVTGAEAEGTKHTFKLEVTDPGGLKSETSRELTIQ
jgi:prepilin-type N-terminal cleavage/methylation domain-containing protein